jgi:hypothetical protein
VSGPVFVPFGTVATICVFDQELGATAEPLNTTAGPLGDVPKFAPPIVTTVPASPERGETPVTEGGATTVSVTPLLVCPPEVTVTGPVWAPAGIWVTMLLSVQELAREETPLKLTVPLDPNPEPLMLMVSPISPVNSESPRMAGTGGVRVNATVLLGMLFTVTCTGPVVAAAGT